MFKNVRLVPEILQNYDYDLKLIGISSENSSHFTDQVKLTESPDQVIESFFYFLTLDKFKLKMIFKRGREKEIDLKQFNIPDISNLKILVLSDRSILAYTNLCYIIFDSFLKPIHFADIINENSSSVLIKECNKELYILLDGTVKKLNSLEILLQNIQAFVNEFIYIENENLVFFETVYPLDGSDNSVRKDWGNTENRKNLKPDTAKSVKKTEKLEDIALKRVSTLNINEKTQTGASIDQNTVQNEKYLNLLNFRNNVFYLVQKDKIEIYHLLNNRLLLKATIRYNRIIALDEREIIIVQEKDTDFQKQKKITLKVSISWESSIISQTFLFQNEANNHSTHQQKSFLKLVCKPFILITDLSNSLLPPPFYQYKILCDDLVIEKNLIFYLLDGIVYSHDTKTKDQIVYKSEISSEDNAFLDRRLLVRYSELFLITNTNRKTFVESVVNGLIAESNGYLQDLIYFKFESAIEIKYFDNFKKLLKKYSPNQKIEKKTDENKYKKTKLKGKIVRVRTKNNSIPDLEIDWQSQINQTGKLVLLPTPVQTIDYRSFFCLQNDVLFRNSLSIDSNITDFIIYSGKIGKILVTLKDKEIKFYEINKRIKEIFSLPLHTETELIAIDEESFEIKLTTYNSFETVKLPFMIEEGLKMGKNEIKHILRNLSITSNTKKFFVEQTEFYKTELIEFISSQADSKFETVSRNTKNSITKKKSAIFDEKKYILFLSLLNKFDIKRTSQIDPVFRLERTFENFNIVYDKILSQTDESKIINCSGYCTGHFGKFIMNKYQKDTKINKISRSIQAGQPTEHIYELNIKGFRRDSIPQKSPPKKLCKVTFFIIQQLIIQYFCQVTDIRIRIKIFIKSEKYTEALKCSIQKEGLDNELLHFILNDMSRSLSSPDLIKHVLLTFENLIISESLFHLNSKLKVNYENLHFWVYDYIGQHEKAAESLLLQLNSSQKQNEKNQSNNFLKTDETKTIETLQSDSSTHKKKIEESKYLENYIKKHNLIFFALLNPPYYRTILDSLSDEEKYEVFSFYNDRIPDLDTNAVWWYKKEFLPTDQNQKMLYSLYWCDSREQIHIFLEEESKSLNLPDKSTNYRVCSFPENHDFNTTPVNSAFKELNYTSYLLPYISGKQILSLKYGNRDIKRKLFKFLRDKRNLTSLNSSDRTEILGEFSPICKTAKSQLSTNNDLRIFKSDMESTFIPYRLYYFLPFLDIKNLISLIKDEINIFKEHILKLSKLSQKLERMDSLDLDDMSTNSELSRKKGIDGVKSKIRGKIIENGILGLIIVSISLENGILYSPSTKIEISVSTKDSERKVRRNKSFEIVKASTSDYLEFIERNNREKIILEKNDIDALHQVNKEWIEKEESYEDKKFEIEKRLRELE